MKFNETILHIVIFIVIYNLLYMLELRLKVGTKEGIPKALSLVIIPTMFVATILFVASSIYIAFKGFSIIYSGGMALLATSFFGVTGVVLIRKLLLVFSAVRNHKKKVEGN